MAFLDQLPELEENSQNDGDIVNDEQLANPGPHWQPFSQAQKGWLVLKKKKSVYGLTLLLSSL